MTVISPNYVIWSHYKHLLTYTSLSHDKYRELHLLTPLCSLHTRYTDIYLSTRPLSKLERHLYMSSAIMFAVIYVYLVCHLTCTLYRHLASHLKCQLKQINHLICNHIFENIKSQIICLSILFDYVQNISFQIAALSHDK